MSEPRTLFTITASSSSPCGSSTATSRSISKARQGKSQDKKDAEVPLATASKELQSPQRLGYSISSGLNHGNSPNDLEPSQEIVWGPMSPPSSWRGQNARTLEVSDIVNLIAPKETKPQGKLSPLWQWMGENLTPEMPKARVGKKSIRQNGLNELIKLARQFDENMQQNQEALVQLNNEISKAPTETPTLLNQTEAELRALFDLSTQMVSGDFSPVSSKSSLDKSQINKSSSNNNNNNNIDFDDDWDNDDMLNDPFLLALMQNPDQDSGPVLHSPQTNLRDLCPKVKPTTRSTFKLESNPHFQISVQPNLEISKKKIHDCKWDDRDDDALFYQACDSVEKLSQSATTPLLINQTMPTNRKSPGNFIRSNSLPGETLRVHQGQNAQVSNSVPVGGHIKSGREPSKAAFKRSVYYTCLSPAQWRASAQQMK
ncbi:uncharacterized protein LOC144061535 isoform X2 [Vanacampus margaritifer]